MKKKYISPEFEWLQLHLVDVVLASGQRENRYIDIGELDPIEDPDDPWSLFD